MSLFLLKLFSEITRRKGFYLAYWLIERDASAKFGKILFYAKQ